MPNRCYNKLTIKSSTNKSLEEFYHDNMNITTCLSFNILMKVYIGNQTLFKAYTNRWGCSSDAIEPQIFKYVNCYVYEFYTIFDPPTKWVLEMSRRYDDIEFYLHCEEPLMNMYYDYVFSKNENTFSEKKDYFKTKYIELNCESVVTLLYNFFIIKYPHFMNTVDLEDIFNSQNSIFVEVLKMIDEKKYSTMSNYIMRILFDKLSDNLFIV